MKIAITGVLNYSGKYMAREARARGHEVVGLTNSLQKPNPDNLPLHPLSWDDSQALKEAMQGCDVLINTYWVRFVRNGFSLDEVLEHTQTLFDCARESGVSRIVHVSITNPDKSSPIAYFRGKAVLEERLAALGLPHSILRPAILFGGEQGEDILLNNMAWALRRFPFVGLFGNGLYRLQPIHVNDFALLAIDEAERKDGSSTVIEAIGPETFTFKGLFEAIGKAIGHERPAVPMPPVLAFPPIWMLGWVHGDIMLTWDEVKGLMEDKLYVPGAGPAGKTALTEWVASRADVLGLTYSSELARRAPIR